jgi:uncharacterized repeat protein (TIGR01451 family)
MRLKSFLRLSSRDLVAVCVAGAAAALLLVTASKPDAATLPSGFQESVVFSGLANPTAVRFSPDGRIFIAEKRGVIKVFDNLTDTTPDVFADLNVNVYNFWDRGLLGLALDPNFPGSPYVYVMYTYDAAIGGSAPRWGTPGVYSEGCPTPPGATDDGCVVAGRISRLTASGNRMTGSEQVLVEDWCQQYPSHSIGSLNFGSDGALYASGGDGASFNFADWGQDGNPLNPCGDPPGGAGATLAPPTAEGGALRSQDLRTTADPTSLDGTVIRIDPATGNALPDNPNAFSSDPNARRIVAHGFRNPFRFTIRPGTNDLWIGDVGWSTWEEIDRLPSPTAGVLNMGWPCYEGVGIQGAYDSANLNLCENLYTQSGAVTPPLYTYNHSSNVVAGESCPTGSSSISGIAFYGSGAYPSNYAGALFFADFSRNCIWVMFAGSNGLPNAGTISTFTAGAAGPVDLQIGPGGDLFYVDLNGGTIRRISYFSANQPPTARIVATPTNGSAPLLVSFDGTTSTDPDPGDQLSYSWDLDGNGTFGDSTAAKPTFNYTTPGTYTVRLRVTDRQGASSTASVAITANNTPPTPVIDTPPVGTTWMVGDTISLHGSATDAQDGTLQTAALSWSVILQHCPSTCHQHPVQDFVGTASASFTAPDHEYLSYLEVRLTATDSGGLSTTTNLRLDPKTVVLSFATNPSGLQLVVGSTGQATPFTRTVIQRSTNSISATTPQTLGGTSYAFSSWSDGGAQSHTVVASSSASYTATYIAQSADVRVVKTGALSADGKSVTWNLTVTNSGPQSATGVVLTDALSSQTSFGSVTTSVGTCSYAAGAQTVSCPIGSLANGQSAQIQIVAAVTKAKGWVDNTAQVTATTPDANAANNSSSVRVKTR